MGDRNTLGATPGGTLRNIPTIGRNAAIHMAERIQDECGKCGAKIDVDRRIDFTLKDGTRVCDSCFVKGTARPTPASDDLDD
jgi:hypothetical protein